MGVVPVGDCASKEDKSAAEKGPTIMGAHGPPPP